MSKFKVGDSARILNVDAIMFGREYWRSGDVVRCVGSRLGNPRFESSTEKFKSMIVTESEWHAIEKVEAAPQKIRKKDLLARIEVLEAKLEALQ